MPAGPRPSPRAPRGPDGRPPGHAWSEARHAAVVVLRKLLHEDPVDLEAHVAQRARLVALREEGALEAHDEDALHLVGAEPKGPRGDQDLVRHRGVRDEPAVGVERDPQALVEVEAERMLLEAAD